MSCRSRGTWIDIGSTWRKLLSSPELTSTSKCTCAPDDKAGHADVADDLALTHLAPGAMPGAEPGHMAIGRLVAVGMQNARVLAELTLGAGCLDDAAAGSQDRRARRAGPVLAEMHSLDLQQHRVATAAEARREPRIPAAHRTPHQELARGAASAYRNNRPSRRPCGSYRTCASLLCDVTEVARSSPRLPGAVLSSLRKNSNASPARTRWLKSV